MDAGLNMKEVCYWDPFVVTKNGRAGLLDGTDEEVIASLGSLLAKSVKRRMISDVPLGAFLSGGIDSSLVAALMQKQSPKPVRTFTIGFHEGGYDEAKSAKKVAEYLGTEHTELYVTPREMMDIVPGLPDIYDEPFADSSQIPTYLISKLTRRYVTVSLSGDGGDEVFGGYNRYIWADRTWKSIRMMPPFARKGMASLINGISPAKWDDVSQRTSFLMPQLLGHRLFGEKMHKLAGVLGASSPDELYQGLASHWGVSSGVVLGARGPETILENGDIKEIIPGFVDRMMLLDLVTYLPDDILTKVDRASMAVSLEARVPFLDHEVVEFSKRLPLSLKIRKGRSKWILRKILHAHVPEELVNRSKMGFGVPLEDWLRGPLKDWAEGLLDESDIKKDGILDPAPIKRLWQEHLSVKRNWQHRLWDVLMFQSWKRRWM